MLSTYIANQSKRKPILLMTHIVVGYPSFPESLRLVDVMVEAGVDLMELQIPFSEPIADGPVIAHANQQSLLAGSSVERCLEFAKQVTSRHSIPFLFMSYYNVMFRRGTDRFVQEMSEAGIRGAIIPDLPPEEGHEYVAAAKQHGVDPIFIFSPTTSTERLTMIAQVASGFVYCVARQGVTGQKTQFTLDLDHYLARCRAATSLPLALGFGVRNRQDVAFLEGKVEIAVIGSETLRIIDERGIDAVGAFVTSLRA